MKNHRAWILLLIGAATLTIRAILDSSFANGTLLYLVVPFAISVALYGVTRPTERSGLMWEYLNHLRAATIIFLATSALLFEGFLCVLMFMPIYYLLVTVGYAFRAMLDRNRTNALAIPAVIAALASEGMLPSTTIPREDSATYTTVANAAPEALQRNMAAPIDFPKKRAWFISLFPLPDEVQAGTLKAGDVHRLHFTYKKWFFANYSEGELLLKIDKVTPTHIRTKVLHNSAYLSHYMRIEGTDVYFDRLPGGRTKVSLTVHYERLLDPAWYFAPMQRTAALQSARYLVDTIIIREDQSHGA